MNNRSIKQRVSDYLNRLIEINEREFGIGSLSLYTYEKISRRKIKSL